MKRKIALTGSIFWIVLILTGCSAQNDFPVLRGEYLGQKPPGLTPVIFAPGIISTEKKELNSVFTPDGKEFYFSINMPDQGYTIMFTKEEAGRWIKPQVSPFYSGYPEVDMCISYDGKKIFYGSRQPLTKGGEFLNEFQIWFVERAGNSWSEPKNLGSPINDGGRVIYPTITKDGTLYFQSRRAGGFGESDVYRSRFVDGKYTKPENLGSTINSEYNEGDVLIAADESYLIVNVSDKPDGFGKGDLYISFRNQDGPWSELKNMGNKINTSATEYCPMISPDGKYFFYTCTQTGNGDIYWVDAQVIEDLKPAELK